MITKDFYGKTKDGVNVDAYTLDNGKIKAVILTYGGIIKNLYVPSKNGEMLDIVLGCNSLQQYEGLDMYFGAIIGRVGNRIKDGKFTLNGVNYQATINNNGHTLHGGVKGFTFYVWDIIEAKDIDGEPTLVLHLLSKDGDQGYPGNLNVTVTYKVTKDNALSIHYEAETDKDTLCNLTNHAYFNLDGHASGDIKSTLLQLNASFFTPSGKDCMPHGEIWKVDGTPMDFRKPLILGDGIASDYEQIKQFEGYDNNFILDGEGMRQVGYAESKKSGIKMEISTDLPCMQLYTSGALEPGIYKDGAKYELYQAFCLETQDIPNAINHHQYKAPILRKGEKYDTTTLYKFV